MGEWLPGSDIGSSFEDCLEVSAYTNGKAEKVVVINDAAIAAEQGRMFMLAGHTTFSTRLVTLHLNRKGEYIINNRGYATIGVVYKEAVPSRYARADFNPGISVYEYDKMVLKRK